MRCLGTQQTQMQTLQHHMSTWAASAAAGPPAWAGLTRRPPATAGCSGHTRALPACEVAVRDQAAASAAAAATPGATASGSPSGALAVRRNANSSASVLWL